MKPQIGKLNNYLKKTTRNFVLSAFLSTFAPVFGITEKKISSYKIYRLFKQNMANNTKNHQLPIWTEVEYTALCKNPFIDTPFFIPKESKVFLCREDGSREEQRMIFLVFKSTAAAEDAEWEDDPIPGELWVKPLEDDDTEEYEPAKIIYLGQDIDDFINVVSEDDNTITFDFYWRHGEVKVEKAEKTDEGFVCKKEDFGEEGLRLTLIPEEDGNPFSINLQIPYIGFSLYDAEDHKVHGEIEVAHDQIDNYRYEFVGNDTNDRFSLHLDNDKLIYICVLRPESAQLVVRDQRERLSVVDQIPSEGKLSQLMMNAHSALIKNKNYRWRVNISGSSIAQEVELEINPESLVAFIKEQMAKGTDMDTLGQQLIAMEQKYAFQWFWLKDSDWSHDDPMFDMFMNQLVAFSFVTQKPIQGDQLQARNNKRKIKRCAKLIKAHQKGEISLWEEEEEQRKEILHLFSTFHGPFTEMLESLNDESGED